MKTEDELDAKIAKLFDEDTTTKVEQVNGKPRLSATRRRSPGWNVKKKHAAWKKPVGCF